MLSMNMRRPLMDFVTLVMFCICVITMIRALSPKEEQIDFSRSMLFDGKRDFIHIAYHPVHPDVIFTVEAWIFPDSASQNQVILTRTSHEQDSSFSLWISPEESNLYLAVCDSETIDTRSQMTLNDWTHLAMSYDSSKVRLYLNGIETYDTFTSATRCPALPDLWIGAYPTGESAFGGRMTDVRLWNLVRTAEEISSNHLRRLSGKEPGLVGYWRLDDDSGTQARDSAWQQHGTLAH